MIINKENYYIENLPIERCCRCPYFPLYNIEYNGFFNLKQICQLNHYSKSEPIIIIRNNKEIDFCIECKKTKICKNLRKLYFCFLCFSYICEKCKIQHEKKYKNHECINYYDINFICQRHKKNYIIFCFNCFKHLCDECSCNHENKINLFEFNIDYKNLEKNFKTIEINFLIFKEFYLKKLNNNKQKENLFIKNFYDINLQLFNFSKTLINFYNHCMKEKKFNYFLLQSIKNLKLNCNFKINENLIFKNNNKHKNNEINKFFNNNGNNICLENKSFDFENLIKKQINNYNSLNIKEKYVIKEKKTFDSLEFFSQLNNKNFIIKVNKIIKIIDNLYNDLYIFENSENMNKYLEYNKGLILYNNKKIINYKFNKEKNIYFKFKGIEFSEEIYSINIINKKNIIIIFFDKILINNLDDLNNITKLKLNKCLFSFQINFNFFCIYSYNSLFLLNLNFYEIKNKISNIIYDWELITLNNLDKKYFIYNNSILCIFFKDIIFININNFEIIFRTKTFFYPINSIIYKNNILYSIESSKNYGSNLIFYFIDFENKKFIPIKNISLSNNCYAENIILNDNKLYFQIINSIKYISID